MKPIIPPVNPRILKADITNLQDGLLLLLEKHVLRGNPEGYGPLIAALREKQRAQQCGRGARERPSICPPTT